MDAWIVLVIILLVVGMACLFWLWHTCCSGPGPGYFPDLPESGTMQMGQISNEKYERNAAIELAQLIRPTQDRQKKEVTERGYTTALLIFKGQQPPELIIGVDARPIGIGGYCLDLTTKSWEYYALTVEQLPWELHDKSRIGDSPEFEMKNLMFALLLWENRICGKTRVEIFTDNFSILKKKENLYGERPRKLIEHFNNCSRSPVKIWYKVINRNDMEKFSRFIQPADDLSRGRIGEAVVYLRTVYELDELKTVKRAIVDKSSRWEDPDNFIGTVKDAVKRWQSPSPCPNCSYRIGSTDSLRSIHIRA